jgi:hypothetical protein
MTSTSAERDLDEFLAKRPVWLQKILLLELPLTAEEQYAWVDSDWWSNGAADEQECVRLLRRIPTKWRQYRRRRIKAALATIPIGQAGRPRKDTLAEEAKRLHSDGMSHKQIADALNRKHGSGSTTREGARKLLSPKRRSAPDKT